MLAAQSAIALLLGAAPPTPALERLPQLALEVMNPRRVGHRLLLIDQLIGPTAAKPTRALLLVALHPGRLQPKGWDLERLSALAQKSEVRGGEVVGVVLGRLESGRGDLGGTDPESLPFALVQDPHGMARRRLGLLGAGWVMVVRSDGRVVGIFAPERSGAKDAVAEFERELEEGSR